MKERTALRSATRRFGMLVENKPSFDTRFGTAFLHTRNAESLCCGLQNRGFAALTNQLHTVTV